MGEYGWLEVLLNAVASPTPRPRSNLLRLIGEQDRRGAALAQLVAEAHALEHDIDVAAPPPSRSRRGSTGSA